ncbi:MAG: hypothetical protein ACREU9_13540 [Gammaproteobacteria bacterium]
MKLQCVTETTGGKYYDAQDMRTLAAAFTAIGLTQAALVHSEGALSL